MKKNKITRREFIKKTGAVSALGATAGLAGCTSFLSRRDPATAEVNDRAGYDFIIVGAGAGGGPLASALALKRYKVLLLEAGSNQSNELVQTPAFHPQATASPLVNWSYFVQRYSANGANKSWDTRNSKYREKGIYYPRATGLGGCTQVNALINLYPDNSDWENIKTITGDSSWSASDMYKIFLKMQAGNGGWYGLNMSPAQPLLKDDFLRNMALATFRERGLFNELLQKNFLLQTGDLNFDPNNIANIKYKYDGIFNIPINAPEGIRRGVRELLLKTQNQYGQHLTIKTDSLCAKVLFDQTKAIGVEVWEGAHLYSADVKNQDLAPKNFSKVRYFANEVILAGGAFNSPQLLQLSGIGDKDKLPRDIPLVKDLPGVGQNLQDRYEVTVVSELNKDIDALANCNLGKDLQFASDPCWKDYQEKKTHHIYSTNGVAIAIIQRSNSQLKNPDLCIFGLPAKFTGYFPGWEMDSARKNYFSWSILKGHTKNHAGSVSLRSMNGSDPRETPEIDFRYFQDGSAGYEQDLAAVMTGLNVARNINKKIGGNYIKREVYPGSEFQDEIDLKSWIMREAWGHHASCSNKMGRAEDPMAVVDSHFRVHGVQNLRVVDASVFPDIPGLFIMLPTLIISEKAAETIAQDYEQAKDMSLRRSGT